MKRLILTLLATFLIALTLASVSCKKEKDPCVTIIKVTRYIDTVGTYAVGYPEGSIWSKQPRTDVLFNKVTAITGTLELDQPDTTWKTIPKVGDSYCGPY